MKATTIAVEDKVDELLDVLDEDIRHIEGTLSRLNELRSLVVKRDGVALGRLLESIHAESESHGSHELKRQSIRKELAITLGCGFEQMTISRLEGVLWEEKRAQVNQRKTKLSSLIKELKREHLSTTLLLSECARFNKLLLNSIVGLGKTGTLTYSSSGAASRQTDEAFVNLRL